MLGAYYDQSAGDRERGRHMVTHHLENIRSHLVDGVLLTPIIGGFYAMFAGINLAWWAPFLGVVYTLMLIAHKAFQMRHMFAAMWRWGRRLAGEP